MRIQPWMTAVAGAVMLLASQSRLSGQTPEMADPSMYGGYGGQNAYYQPPAGPGGAVDPYTLYPQGVPENFQPWPQMSPFSPGNVAQTQHYNSGGLWFKEMLYQKRTYYTSIEAMVGVYRDAGDAVIGSPYAGPTYNGFAGGAAPSNGAVPPYAGAFPQVPPTGSTPYNGFYPVSPLIFPFPSLDNTAGTYVTVGNGSDHAFPIYNADVLGKAPTTGGIKLRGGFFNEDDTGFMMTGWYGGQATSDFSRGNEFINGVRVNQSITLALGGQNLTPVNGNIPLYNGLNFGPGGGSYGLGSTAKYDVLYSVKFKTEAGGANFNIYQEPIFKSQGFKLRPLYGMRYTYIGESFNFRGIDSGFTYDVDGITAGGTGGGTGGGTTGTAGTFRPTGTLTPLYNQYQATLNSTVQSNITGPEIGFRIDLGEPTSGFKMWGETNLGLAVNNEQIKLSGDNIGDALTDARFFGGPAMLDPNNVSTFGSKKSNTHASPMFQQSIFADMNLLDVIPGVKRMTMFENATFRLGYTIFWVGSVARPADSILWQGFPLYPEIRNNRQSWWMNQFSFALDWTF